MSVVNRISADCIEKLESSAGKLLECLIDGNTTIQTDRQTGRQTDRQIDRHKETDR